MRPLTLECDEAKQHIKQHGRPELPAYGMLGVTKVPSEATRPGAKRTGTVADLEGLFDLFKEGFDAPSASIQIADTRSGPI